MNRFSLLLLALAGVLSLNACRESEPTFRRAEHAERAEAVPARVNEAHTDQLPPQARRPTPPPARPAPTITPVPTPPALLQPANLTEQAPATFNVLLETTAGEIRMTVTRAWSPNGADRFYNLVSAGYYTNIAFFRVMEGFMGQFGIHGDPRVNTAWHSAQIQDDPVVQHNTRGMVSYAMAGPGTRTTQIFINFADNSNLDGMGFSPFARVDEASMAVVDRIYSGYGEGAPSGRGPAQGRMQAEGNAYLQAEFPMLDYIRSARVL